MRAAGLHAESRPCCSSAAGHPQYRAARRTIQTAAMPQTDTHPIHDLLAVDAGKRW